MNPISSAKFTPGAWRDYLPEPVTDLDWVGFASTDSLVSDLINFGQTEVSEAGRVERSLISHVGQVVTMDPVRAAFLGDMGYPVPDAWIGGEPLVLEALMRLALTPLAVYLEAGRPLMIARWLDCQASTKHREAETLLNFVGHVYGVQMIAAHGLGSAVALWHHLWGDNDAAWQARLRWVRRVDGEMVCSTWGGVGLQAQGMEVWRHPDPANRAAGERPLPAKLQSPDMQFDQFRHHIWGTRTTLSPTLARLIYTQKLSGLPASA